MSFAADIRSYEVLSEYTLRSFLAEKAQIKSPGRNVPGLLIFWNTI